MDRPIGRLFRRRGGGILGLGLALAGLGLSGDPPRRPGAAAVIEASYGSDPLQRLDLWPVDGGERAPVLIYFHGGGFCGGDKRDVPEALIERCREAGIALISANYRLTPGARYPAPMLDGARLVQFVRAHAQDLGVDGARIALAGNSAGAGIALWTALHEDLGRPGSDHPIGRESTRVACVAVVGAQTSYDPREIREWIGGRSHEHPALAAFLPVGDGEAGAAVRREASPITHVSADDPPVWMSYSEPAGPLGADARPGQGIHHPNFGFRLRERMERLGRECEVRLEPASPIVEAELVAFVRRQLSDRAARGAAP